jgi:hypothetical protein
VCLTRVSIFDAGPLHVLSRACPVLFCFSFFYGVPEAFCEGLEGAAQRFIIKCEVAL